MNKQNLPFKIISIVFVCIDIAFALFFLINFILVLAKISVLNNLHLILFLIMLAIYISYIIYISIILIKNKKLMNKKRKVKLSK